MKLYELSDTYDQLLADEAFYGEDEEFQELLAFIEDSLSEKAENITKIIKSLEKEVEVFKITEQEMRKKRQARERRIDWLKEYLEQNMVDQGEKKLKTDLFSVWIQKNPKSLQIEDEEVVPEEFKEEETRVKIDRRGLLKHLEETGEVIDGIEITQTESIRIR